MPIKYMPESWRPRLIRIRNFFRSDATALLILGGGILGRGLSYIPGVLGPAPLGGSHPAEFMLPMQVWAVIWVSIGLGCIAAAFANNKFADAVGIGFGVGLTSAWGFSFIGATVFGDSPRGWVSSIGYVSVALLVVWAIWRGKRGDANLEEGSPE